MMGRELYGHIMVYRPVIRTTSNSKDTRNLVLKPKSHVPVKNISKGYMCDDVKVEDNATAVMGDYYILKNNLGNGHI